MHVHVHVHVEMLSCSWFMFEGVILEQKLIMEKSRFEVKVVNVGIRILMNLQ